MTYRLPSLNTLRAFEAAGRHLSFATAANELGVTAGAVSQQVRKLEVSLGVALFRRLPQGVVLTREGEAYLSDVSRVFEDLTTATEAIAPRINAKKFTVGVSADVRPMLPPEWPHRVDGLSDHVRECVDTDDIERVRRDEVDCLLRLAGGPYGDLALVVVPGERALHFVCKPGVVACRQSEAILADLRARFVPARRARG